MAAIVKTVMYDVFTCIPYTVYIRNNKVPTIFVNIFLHDSSRSIPVIKYRQSMESN